MIWRNDLGNKVKHVANVGMLFHGYYPRDVRVRRQAEALSEEGYNVVVICLRSPKQPGKKRESSKDKVNGVFVYRLPFSRKRGRTLRYIFEYLGLIILGGWKLTWLHFKSSFQIVHIHNMPDLLVLAGFIPKLMGAKLLLDIHDPMPELYKLKTGIIQYRLVEKILKLEEKFSCWLADRVISVNKAMYRNLKEKGVSIEKIFIIHNFPDTKYFPIKENNTRWPRHKDGLILLYAGTITEHYRLDIAIEALSIVIKNINCVKLRILGDGNKLEQVLKLACNLGVFKYIEHIKTVDVEKVKDVMKDVDIGISSHQGGIFGDLYFATKVLDYLTQGLPVVCSRTDTMMLYIPEDGIFYFEPGNAEDMAKKILKIWNNPDLVSEKMKNAKKFIYKYTWQKEKPNFIHFYQNIIK